MASLARAGWSSGLRDAADTGTEIALAMLSAELGEPLAVKMLERSRHRSFQSGQVVVADGQVGRTGLLLCGLLGSAASLSTGQNPTFRYIAAGELYGLSTLFHASPMSVHAVRPSSVVELDSASVIQLAHECPRVGWFLAGELARTLNHLPAMVEHFGFRSVRERIAGHVLRLAGPEGTGSPRVAHVTHESLADAVGSVREVVTRCLHSLRDAGLIRVAPRAVYILDEAGLTRVRDSA
jgi:CRP/FNR family transcriptional regulator, cyclic AMP receptor protein